MLIASLPWYDLPEVKSTTDLLWDSLRVHLQKYDIKAPQKLCRSIPYQQQWRSENLLFSQACGYDVIKKPFVKTLKVIATPCYAVSGCKDHHYSSYIVVHRRSSATKLCDLHQKVAAINGMHSHSGMNILRFIIASNIGKFSNFFSRLENSGSHENSIEMISVGKADVAAIDCTTFKLLEKYRPSFLKNIRILCGTPHAPAPPFVTSSKCTPERLEILRKCLRKCLENNREICNRLFFGNMKIIPREDYILISDMEKKALGCVDI